MSDGNAQQVGGHVLFKGDFKDLVVNQLFGFRLMSLTCFSCILIHNLGTVRSSHRPSLAYPLGSTGVKLSCKRLVMNL